MIGIGIDFGTSNSSLAVYDGHELVRVRIDHASADPDVMPTALYLDRERQGTVGQAAIDTYLRDNAGRLVELERETLGEIEYTVGDTGDDLKAHKTDGANTHVAQVHAFVDRALPGRLFRGLKRWLTRADLERVQVFDRRFRIVALLTPILAHMREAMAEIDTRDARVYVGRPVVFEGPPEGEATAVARLAEACQLASLGPVTLFPEPVAAALSFVRERELATGDVVLCFDFGGGTLDLCALRATGDGFTTLVTHGISLGGDAIDRLLFRHKLFPALGEGARMPSNSPTGPRYLPFPFRDFGEQLLNWQLAYDLNLLDLRELMARGARSPGQDGECIGRLLDVVGRNLAYPLMREVERAKVELSTKAETELELPDLDLVLPLSRVELERVLEEPLRRIEEAVDTTLEKAALSPGDVVAVARTGGSSRIPAVREVLEARFPGRVLEHATFTGIATGLAFAASSEWIGPECGGSDGR